MATFSDCSREIINLPAHTIEIILDFLTLLSEVSKTLLLGSLRHPIYFDVVRGFLENAQNFFERTLLKRICANPGQVAISPAPLARTSVCFQVASIALRRSMSIEGRTAPSALGQTAEQITRVNAPRVINAFDMRPACIFFVDILHLFPQFLGNHRFAIIFKPKVAKLKNATINWIAPKGCEGIQRAKDASRFVDFMETGAGSAHDKGFSDTWNPVRIWYPAVCYSYCAIPANTHLYRFALEPTWRHTWYTSMFFHEFTEPAFGVPGSLTLFLLVGNVDQNFNNMRVHSIWNGICQGMDGDTAFSQGGFVILRIIQVAGKACVVPNENTFGTGNFMLAHINHFVEGITPDRGTTRTRFINK